MTHVYNDDFYRYIERGARSSARIVAGLLVSSLRIESVLDVGCGRGAWLDEWKKSGAHNVVGVDGDYVERDQLHIPESSFVAKNLSEPFDIGRRFDLVQSLEVAEHLEHSVAKNFVYSLTRHGDIVLFSAATPGQGGENHVNEQPLSYWRDIFESYGFRPYDFVRPSVKTNDDVMPWYRYNTLLYVSDAAQAALPEDIQRTAIATGQPISEYGSFGWRLRKAVVSKLPRTAVDAIAVANAKRVSRQ